jgi:hypothetical protein
MIQIEKVQLIDRATSKPKSTGTLHLIEPSHIVFVEAESKRELWVYFSLISSFDKLPLTISGSPILIRCKHFLNLLFIVSKDSDCQLFNAALNSNCRKSKIKIYFIEY